MIEGLLDVVLRRYDENLDYWESLPEEQWPTEDSRWLEDGYDAAGLSWLQPAGLSFGPFSDVPLFLLGGEPLAEVLSDPAGNRTLSELQEHALEARRRKTDLRWAEVLRAVNALPAALDLLGRLLGPGPYEEDWRAWALIGEAFPETAVSLSCYENAIRLRDMPELRSRLAWHMMFAGSLQEATKQCVRAKRIRPGLILMEVGDKFVERHESSEGLRCYELAMELAPNPKIQFEMGCAMLARARVQDLSWAYPFWMGGVAVADETFSIGSELDKEFLNNIQVTDPDPALGLAVTALGRAHQVFLGFSVEDWSGSLVGGPYEARAWDEQCLKALGLAFAKMREPEGVQAVFDELQAWGYNDSFLADDRPQTFMRALPAPPPPHAMAEDWEALERRFGFVDWTFLCSEAKRHLVNAEHHLRLAAEGEMEADDAVVRYVRALEAQTKWCLKPLLSALKQDPPSMNRMDEMLAWLQQNRVWTKAYLNQHRLGKWCSFFTEELPDLWNRDLRVFRNRAAHGNQDDHPIRLQYEALKVKKCLLDPAEEGGGAVFERLASFSRDFATQEGRHDEQRRGSG